MSLRKRYGLFLKKARERIKPQRGIKKQVILTRKAEATGRKIPKKVNEYVSKKQKELSKTRDEKRITEDKFFEKEMSNDKRDQKDKRITHTAVFKTSSKTPLTLRERIRERKKWL